jgi:predicted RNase H-like HicB family nuclease
MQTAKYLHWGEEDGTFIGYFLDYLNDWTQGTTLDDLKERLRELYADLTSGQIPGVRRIDELAVS